MSSDDNEEDLSEREASNNRLVTGFPKTLIVIDDEPLTDAEIKYINQMWGKPFIYEEHKNDTKGDV
jgi:hypothetical protein